MPLNRYSRLWSDSPFTSKPPPAAALEQANPLEDYALLGVSPISSSGYRVTLINKKQPEERIIVDSDKTNTPFKILEVIRKSGDPLGTEVRMSSGSMSGKVSFDSKLLVIIPASPLKGQNNPLQPQANGIPQPSMQANANSAVPVRQPRPRVIPPPAAQAPAGGAPQPTQAPTFTPRPERRIN